MARLTAFVLLASLTCQDSTGLDPSDVVLEITGPASVRVAESIELTAAVPGADGLGPGVVRWRVLDTTLLTIDSIGVRANVLGRRPGTTSVEAVLFAPDLPAQVVATRELTVDPGAPTQLIIVQAPADSARAGIILPTTPTVQLADVGGNAVPTAGIAVTAEVASGTGTLTGAVAVTNASGLATFGSLALTGRVGTYRVRFIGAGALVPDTTSAIQLRPGDPERVGLFVLPSTTASAGVALAQQPVAQLRDLADNDVAQAGAWVRARVQSCAACVIEADSVQTNAAGRAAFTALRFGGPSGRPYGLAFSGSAGARTLGPDTTVTVTLEPGLPASLGFDRRPAGRARVGIPLDTQPRILLRDAYGNTVQAANRVVTATISPSGALGGATATTDASGVAAFSSLALTGTSGAYELRFTSTTLADTTAGAVTLGYGPPAALRFYSEPLDVSAGSILGDVRVQVEDAGGNVVVNHASAVSVALSTATSGALLSGLTSALPVSGVARFQDLSVNRAALDFRLRATSDGLEVLSAPFDISPGVRAGLVVIGQPSASGVAGAVLGTQPRVQLVDAFGNAVADSGVVISAAVDGGTGTVTNGIATTDGSGIASFSGLAIGALAGARRLEVSSGGIASALTNVVTISPGAPSALRLSVPPSPSAASGAVLVQQPVIRVEDAFGNPVATSGVSVTAELMGGAGLVGTLTLSSDATGVAAFTDLALASAVGAYQLRFVAAGLQSAVSSNVQVSAGTASRLRFSAQPSSFVAGSTVGQPVMVAVEDAQGNVVTAAAASVSIALANNPGNATLAGGSLVDAVAGLANFVNLNVTLAGTGYILVASAPGLQSATSQPFDVIAGAAERLAILNAPSGAAESGVPLLTQPVVVLQDVYGNRVRQGGVDVTVSTAGATVSGTTTVGTDAEGRAVFTGLAVAGAAGASYALQFAAASLQGVTSSPIALAAGRPARVAFRRQPSNVTAGAPIAPSVEVVLQDLSGNLVAESNRDVSLAVSSGPSGATVSGTSTVQTVAGVAEFADLRLIQQGAGYTLRASADSLATQVSATFDVLAAGASRLSVVSQPPATATSAAPLSSPIVVRLRDDLGNNVATSDVPVTVAVSSGAATLTGTLVVNTDATGAATFSTLTLSGTPETLVLSFSAPSILPVSTNSVSLLAGAPASLAFESQPTEMTAGMTASPSWIVRLRDAAGFPLATGVLPVTVALEDSTGLATLLGTLTRNTIAGAATFNDLTILRKGRRYRLLATAGALSAAESDTFHVVAAAADSVEAASSTSQSGVVGTAVTMAPSVRVLDAHGNAVSGVSVQFTVASGGGLVSGESPVTDSVGIASVAGWTLGQVAGAQTLTATPVLVQSVRGAPVTFTSVAAPSLPAAAASVLTVGGGTSDTVTAGDSIALMFEARDSYGNRVLVGGDTVVFQILSGSSTGTFSATADSSNGRYSAWFRGLLAGTPASISATLNGDAVGTSAVIVGVARGAPASVSVVRSPSAFATVGTAVATTPAVLVRDAGGNPLAGVAVSVTDLTGGAILGANALVTDSSGVAALGSWVLGVPVNTYRLRFAAGAPVAEVSSQSRAPVVGTSVPLVQQSQLVLPSSMSRGSVSGHIYVLNGDSSVVEIDPTDGSEIRRIALAACPTVYFACFQSMHVLESQNAIAFAASTGVIVLYRLSDGAYSQIVSSSSLNGAWRSASDPSRGRTYTGGGDASEGDITKHEVGTVAGLPASTSAVATYQMAAPMGLAVDTVVGVVYAVENCNSYYQTGCRFSRWNGQTLARLGYTPLEPSTLQNNGGWSDLSLAVDDQAGRVYFQGSASILVFDGRSDGQLGEIPHSRNPYLSGASVLEAHSGRRELVALNPVSRVAVILDLDTYAVKATINLPLGPSDLVVASPTQMVGLAGGQATLIRIDLSGGTSAALTSQCCTPGVVRVDAVRDNVLVAGTRRLSVLSAATLGARASVRTSVVAKFMAVDETGGYAFVANDSSSISVIDLNALREVRVLTVPCRIRGLGGPSAAGRLWVVTDRTCSGSNQLHFADRGSSYSALNLWVSVPSNDYWRSITLNAEDPVVIGDGGGLTRYSYPIGAPTPAGSGAFLYYGPADQVRGLIWDRWTQGSYVLSRPGGDIGYLSFVTPTTEQNAGTVPANNAMAMSDSTRTLMVVLDDGATVISRDRRAAVRSLQFSARATSVAFDDRRRRALAIVGSTLQVVDY